MVTVAFYQHWGKDMRTFECTMPSVPHIGEWVTMGGVRGRVEDVSYSCEAPGLPLYARVKVTGFTASFGKD